MELSKVSKVYIRLTENLFKCKKNDVNYNITKTLIEQIDAFPDIYIEEIAHRANTTPASITKFCKKLGYSTFKEMRTDLTNYSDEVMLDYLDNESSPANFISLFLTREMEIQQSIFEILDHDQCQRVAADLKSLKNRKIAIMGNSYSFSAVNFFRELLSQEGFIIFEINRDAEEAIIQEALNESGSCFIINLTGAWTMENQHVLETASAEKYLFTQAPMDEIRGDFKEVIRFDMFDFLMLSNYYSQKVLHIWIILLVMYLKK